MANVSGTEIDLMPTEGMRAEAERYRAWKADGRPGGQDAAAARAGQILSGDELSPDTVITMAAWFARHEVDKEGEGFSPGEEGYPSPGRVAWAAWGGDPGKAWADAKAARIKALQEGRAALGEQARPYPNEHAARLLDPDQFDRFRRENDAGGPGIDFIYGIATGEPVKLQAIRFDASRYTVAEARKWLADHNHDPILFEEATGERGTASSLNAGIAGPMELRELNREPLFRNAVVANWRRADDDPEVVEFSFSSEEPVQRYFGIEVLSHQPGAMNMARLNSGAAPWLWNHNPDVVLGGVEKAWQGKDGRGMVRARWSPNTRAEGSEEWKVRQNWEAGIIRNVSFLYSIDAPLDLNSREGVALVTAFTPMEVSTVSIPADHTVGQGRAIGTQAAPAASTPTPNPPVEDTLNLDEVRAQAAAGERARVASITALARQHGAEDLAQGLIESGASEADAMRQVLDSLAKRSNSQPATPKAATAQPIASGGSADIGLTEKEARSFSFVRAIRAMSYPQDRAMQEAASFEREVSEATAARMGMDRDGLHVPHDVLRRDLTVGTASAAGDLVFTDARPGSFIELLRNRLALSTLGVQTLTGLQGPVAIPKQTGGATAYWVAEKGEPTESNPTVGQINMTPKTLGAFTEFSRRLMLQSSIDVETMVRNELATVMALEIDRAALYGTGSTSQPKGLKFVTGLNTEDFAANQPTYVELVSMESKINADNADIGALSYLTNSTIYGGFKTTSKAGTDAIFVLEPGGTVNGYPVVRSNQVETGDVFFGVWSALIMGMWGSLTLQANPYALDKSGGVRVTAFQDVDVAVRYAECFARGNNTL